MNHRSAIFAAAVAGCLAASLGAHAGPPKELKKAPPRTSHHSSMSQANEIAGKDDLICVYESTIGSHLKRRICSTREERERQASADQNGLRRMQGDNRSRGYASPQPAGPGGP